MDVPPPNYRRSFWKSPHHAWLALLTVGAGFITAQPLFLLIGATAYALGLIYLPDAGFFRNWLDRRRQAAEQALAQTQLTEFLKRREMLLKQLPGYLQERYYALATVCQEIVKTNHDPASGASSAPDDPRVQRLEELLWTYLRLLSIEGSLQSFLETERQENLPQLVASARDEINQLTADIDKLKSQGNTTALDTKQRLRDSRLEYLQVLERRVAQVDQAKANLDLVISEQDRLNQQIKLIRADSIAIKNPEAITARIDATVETLNQTNRWLAEMDQFKDVIADAPPPNQRIGFQPAPPVVSPKPPIINRPSTQSQQNKSRP
jgi:hypothetical protein